MLRHRVALAGTLAATCIGLAACSITDLANVGTTCAGVGYFALDITIRDQLGHAQGLDAKVTLTDGNYVEVDSLGDTLHLFAAGDRGGRTYDIRVSKPFYNDVVISNVRTRGGGCVTGHENPPVTTVLPITLTLAANAPPLRAIHVLPVRYSPLLDRPPYQGSYTPTVVFDADPGVSREVSWSITGDTASIGFDRATGTVHYVCREKSDSVAITARALANPALSDTRVVRFQGHSAAYGDPPC